MWASLVTKTPWRVVNRSTGCSLRSFPALTFSESSDFFFLFVSFHLTPFPRHVSKDPGVLSLVSLMDSASVLLSTFPINPSLIHFTLQTFSEPSFQWILILCVYVYVCVLHIHYLLLALVGTQQLLDKLVIFFFFLLGPHLRHTEVPRLGVESELQLPA